MLVCYARELKEGFAEYAEEVVRIMVPLLKFYFHDGNFLFVLFLQINFTHGYTWLVLVV